LLSKYRLISAGIVLLLKAEMLQVLRFSVTRSLKLLLVNVFSWALLSASRVTTTDLVNPLKLVRLFDVSTRRLRVVAVSIGSTVMLLRLLLVKSNSVTLGRDWFKMINLLFVRSTLVALGRVFPEKSARGVLSMVRVIS